MKARRIAICRRCGKVIEEVAPGRWGHRANPGPSHHYAVPKGTTIEEPSASASN